MKETLVRCDKTLYFEFLRILAASLVIFNHVPGYTLYQTTSGLKQVFYLFCSLFTRINVPLFYMISGALLLNKTEDYRKVVSKRISRILLTMLIFEALMYILQTIKGLMEGENISCGVGEFCREFISGSITGLGSYWYLYSYLGILFMLPLLQRIAKALTRQDIWILIGLHFLHWSAIPILNVILSGDNEAMLYPSENFSVPLATIKGYFFLFMGFYLDKKIENSIKKETCFLLSLLALIGISISCCLTLLEGYNTGIYSQKYMQLFDYVSAIAAFVLVKRLFIWKAVPERTAFLICYIGSLTFGIYLLDPFLQRLFYPLYSGLMTNYVPTFIVSIGWVVLSMFLGGIITMILKKIPFLGKLI